MDAYKGSNVKISKNLLEKWEELQNLLKYEVTLMNMLKTNIDTAIDTVNANVMKYYNNKIKTKQAYDYNNVFSTQIINSSKSINLPNHILNLDTKSTLGNLYIHFEDFFLTIKNNPRSILFIISHLKQQQYDSFISFLLNFFFEEPFNSSSFSPNLLSLISELIKREVSSLKELTVTSFLDNNFLGSLLRSLARNPEIKAYLSKVLGVIILNMDNMSNKFISLELSKINEFIKMDCNSGLRTSFAKKRVKYEERIVGIYLYDGLTHSHLLSREKKQNDSFTDIQRNSQLFLPPEIIDVDEYLKERKKEVNGEYNVELDEKELTYRMKMNARTKFMKEYYTAQIERIKNNHSDFGNDGLIQELGFYREDWRIMLYEYKKVFEKLKYFIDTLIENLLDNILIVPHILKAICRIIYLCLEKRFNNISLVEKNAFIAEFLIGKMIIPILTNPDYNGIITSSIISLETRKIMIDFTKVLKKIFRGNFFEKKMEPKYTIFNIYILEIIPFVNEFIEKICNIELPYDILNIIGEKTDFINNNNTKKQSRNSEVFSHNSVLFTYEDFNIIYNIIKSNESEFLNLIDDNKDNFTQSYKIIQENADEIYTKLSSKSDIIEYFLISKNNFDLSSVEYIIHTKKRFAFNDIENSSQNEEIILKRVKHCIKTILRNINYLNLDYNELKKCKSTIDFFQQLSNVLQIENSSFHTGDAIPLGWYCLYLQYNITQLSRNYLDKDCELLYEQLITEVNHSIFYLHNNSFLGQLELKITRSNKIIEIVEGDLIQAKQIEKFIKLYLLSDNYTFPVLLLENNAKSGAMSVSKEKKKNCNCYTIADFTMKFMRFAKVEDDIISEDQHNKSNEILAQYLSIVKNEIMNNENIYNGLLKEYTHSEELMNEIMDDIENQMVEKMYYKLYPIKPLEQDTAFYLKCKLLAESITPKKLEIKRSFVNEKLWTIVICYINRIEVEKTPMNKLKCINSAYKVLNNCINFCSGKSEGAGFDDIFPIFVYVIIKAKPKRFFSNMKFIKALMNPNKLINTYGFAYMQLEMAVNYINRLTI